MEQTIYRPVIQNYTVGSTGSDPTSYHFVWPFNDYRTGGSVSGYRDLLAHGGNATSPFFGIRHTVTQGVGNITASRCQAGPGTPRTTWNLDGHFLHGYTLGDDPTESVAANNAALADFYGHVKEEHTRMCGLTFLGELRQSIHMIRRPAEALREGLRGYLFKLSSDKRRRHSSFSLRRNLAGTWLEYSFGWKPLIRDTEDGLKALASVLNKIQKAHVSGKGEDERVVEHAFGHQGYVGCPMILDVTLIQTTKTQVRYLGGLRDDPYPKPSALTAFGIGFDEFVPTAWELLPWSFFVDYFSNVGDILSAYYTDTSNLTWVCKTVRQTVETKVSAALNRELTMATYGDDGTWQMGGSAGSLVLRRVTVQRSSEIPGLPSLQVEFPGKRGQWFNLAALVLQHKRMIPYV